MYVLYSYRINRRYLIISTKTQLNKHLDVNERLVIEKMLDNGNSPSAIAKALNRPRKTITTEIKKHITVVSTEKNDCLEYISKTCKERNACTHHCDYKLCRNCKKINCYKVCEDYVKAHCDKLYKSPYVCNGCEKIYYCNHDKQYYKALKADTMANATLHDKRSGFDLTEQQLKEIDDMVSPLIKKGHTPYSVTQILGDSLPVSESTLYRLIDKRALSCMNLDLPERVNRKIPQLKKRKNRDAYAILTAAKVGHLWSDYLKYIAANDIMAVQMDCVIGKRTDKATLLTLHWETPHFQIAILLDSHSAKSVVEALDKIEITLGLELFREMFPIILTDNGEEFTDIEGLQRSCTIEGENRTFIFFCEPNRSEQKGECERNHRLSRRIIPKGTSLELYMQEDINSMVNHVNSYPRKSLGGKCPFDLAKTLFPKDFFVLLGLEQIPSNEVVMLPSLLNYGCKKIS